MSRGAVLLLVSFVVAVSGCGFERRSELGDDTAASATFRESGLRQGEGEVEGRASLEAFLDTLQAVRGRGASEDARSLLHPEALLIDRGAVVRVGAPESELRSLLAPGPSLGEWTVLDRRVWEREGLVLLEYGVRGGSDARAVESILVVFVDGAWKVRLLHRSALP